MRYWPLILFALCACNRTPLSKEEATKVLKRRYDQHDVVWATALVRPTGGGIFDDADVPKVDEPCAKILEAQSIARISTLENGARLRPLKGRFMEGRFEYPCGLWTFDRVESMEVVSAQRVKVRFSQRHNPPSECLSVLRTCGFVRDVPRRTVLEITMDKDTRGDWFPMYWQELSS